ncbi:MAG: hypothetical protein A4E19_04865 [Nitrospira sp. SG-bin1]|nr:MAG: hypothetical protein A4E19_04865 [Nitrospira sp. SG-bin1]
MIRPLLTLACVVVWTSSYSGPGMSVAAQSTEERSHRVVIHLNSGDEKVQRAALNNIRNLHQELGPQNLTVELVVHGAALPLLIKKVTPLAEELADLQRTSGVRYTACSNTMKTLKVTREDLIDEVGDTVPAMVRLMQRQEQGWIYIKP